MKADLHVHTSYSYDSISSPQQIVKTTLEKGIDCIAICDHGKVKGAEETARAALNKPILVIPGIEIKSRQGDIVGLNIKNIIPNNLSARETILAIKKQGGLAVIPHSFGFTCSFKGDLEGLVDIVDAIEVLNANIFKKDNQKALEFSKKHNLAFTAGSDAHSPELIGRAYLEIPGQNLSIEQVLKAIKSKQVKVLGQEINIFEKGIAFLKRSWAKINHILIKKH